MKRTLFTTTVLTLTLILTGCGSSGTATTSEDTKVKQESKSKKEEAVLAEIIKSVDGAWSPYEDSDYILIHGAAIFENKGDVPVKIGETQMNHKSTDGSILDTESMIYSVPRVILPGETAIIGETSYVEGASADEFGETTYNFTFDKTKENPNVVEVEGIKGTPVEDGYKVTGVVKNTTNEQQDDIRLAAALLDAEGNLLGALSTSVDVGIAAGGEAGFEMSYPDLPPNIADKVETIEVKAYAWNW